MCFYYFITRSTMQINSRPTREPNHSWTDNLIFWESRCGRLARGNARGLPKRRGVKNDYDTFVMFGLYGARCEKWKPLKPSSSSSSASVSIWIINNRRMLLWSEEPSPPFSEFQTGFRGPKYPELHNLHSIKQKVTPATPSVAYHRSQFLDHRHQDSPCDSTQSVHGFSKVRET